MTAKPLHHIEADFSKAYLHDAARTVLQARLLTTRMYILLTIFFVAMTIAVYTSGSEQSHTLLSTALGILVWLFVGISLWIALLYRLVQRNLLRVQKAYQHVGYDFYNNHLVVRTAESENRYNYTLVQRLIVGPNGFLLELPLRQLIYIPGQPPSELLDEPRLRRAPTE